MSNACAMADRCRLKARPRRCDMHHFCSCRVAKEMQSELQARSLNAVFFSFFFPSRFHLSVVRRDFLLYSVTHQSIPAGVWVILLPLQLRTHHIGQAPGPAGASPHLPKLPAGAEEASGRVLFVLIEATLTQSRRAIVSFGIVRRRWATSAACDHPTCRTPPTPARRIPAPQMNTLEW